MVLWCCGCQSVDNGLGDWMPVQDTSRAFTGAGFQRMAFLAFANITELLGKPPGTVLAAGC